MQKALAATTALILLACMTMACGSDVQNSRKRYAVLSSTADPNTPADLSQSALLGDWTGMVSANTLSFTADGSLSNTACTQTGNLTSLTLNDLTDCASGSLGCGSFRVDLDSASGR